jgi:hypothetical protein
MTPRAPPRNSEVKKLEAVEKLGIMRFQDEASSRPVPVLLIAVAGWMNQQQQFDRLPACEENRVLREQLGHQ